MITKAFIFGTTTLNDKRYGVIISRILVTNNNTLSRNGKKNASTLNGYITMLTNGTITRLSKKDNKLNS